MITLTEQPMSTRTHDGTPPLPIGRSDDRRLAELLVERHPDALAEAYRRHGTSTYLAAMRVLHRRELAEDVAQDVFARLWQQPGRFDPERGSLGTFLRLDARGRAVDLVRSEVSRSDREVLDHRRVMASDVVVGPEDEVVERLASAGVRKAFESLASAEQKVIALGIFQGLPYRRVAEVLGLPEGTVKSRIRRGLGRLRDLMEADEDGLRALAA